MIHKYGMSEIDVVEVEVEVDVEDSGSCISGVRLETRLLAVRRGLLSVDRCLISGRRAAAADTQHRQLVPVGAAHFRVGAQW